jgi:hypothetical protein
MSEYWKSSGYSEDCEKHGCAGWIVRGAERLEQERDKWKAKAEQDREIINIQFELIKSAEITEKELWKRIHENDAWKKACELMLGGKSVGRNLDYWYNEAKQALEAGNE